VDILVDLVARLISGLIFAIFMRSILSWFPINRAGPIVRALDSVTDPVLDPLRRLIPRIGMIDLSPMVAIIVLFAIRSALKSSAT
jgi:YggT family protein